MRNFLRLLPIAIFLIVTPLMFAAEQQWVEVRSPHFSVVTDGGEKRGREVALRFEQMRTIFGTLFTKVNVNIPVPLQIIAFRNQKELRANAPLFNGKPIELAGYFQQGEDRNFIMLDLSANNAYEAVFHEYAHLLLNGNFPPTPLWFDEGFAEYYSTIKVMGKEVVIGDAPEGRMQYLYSNRINTLQLFSIVHQSKEYNVSGQDRENVYAHSWLMVHYLFDAKKLKEANAYFELVKEKNVPVDQAIKQAFGMDAKELDKTVDAFYRGGYLKKGTMKAPDGMKDIDFNAHPLSSLDTRAIIADLHLHSPDYQQQAVTEFEAVLREDSNNAAAHRGLGYAYLRKNEMDTAREHFRNAAALNSTDPRVHYYSALLLNRQSPADHEASVDEMKAELQKAIALDPDFADCYSLLAFAQMRSGDKDGALQSLTKALQLDPRNENYKLNMSQYLVSNQKFDEAEELLKSLKNSTNPRTADVATSQLQWIDRYRRQRAELERDVEIENVGSSTPDDSNSEAPVAAVNVPLARPKFLKGRLTGVECSQDGSAVLVIASGKTNYRMRTHNRSRLVLIGADSFSCEWKNKSVAVNYVPAAESQGNLISLELQ